MKGEDALVEAAFKSVCLKLTLKLNKPVVFQMINCIFLIASGLCWRELHVTLPKHSSFVPHMHSLLNSS